MTLPAQDARGKIAGQVTDSSGAAIPAATVTAIHMEMNTRVPARTNAGGNYELPYLVSGPYRIVIKSDGFKEIVREPVEVRVGDVLRLDFQMQVGGVSEVVNVTEDAPLVNATSGSVGTVLDQKEISELPGSGGSVAYLTMLTPGVGIMTAPNHPYGPNISTTINSFAGSGKNGSEASLDGVPSMSRREAPVNPPMDAVQEMQVSTVNYDASTGRVPGASINMTLKTGTNALHGTANFDIAPNPWQANDFFTNQAIYNPATGPITSQKIHDMSPIRKAKRYSATFSGPVYLPHLYDGHNRTFWMYAFQAVNRANPSTASYSVPPLDERHGDFSALLASAGSVYQIYDPATTAPAANGRFSRLPFSGNKIPASRLDPLAQRYFAFYPDPNLPGTSDFRNNYTTAPKNTENFDQNLFRIDHVFSDRHRIFGRYTHTFNQPHLRDIFGNGTTGLRRPARTNGLALDDVYVVSPSLLLDVKYGLTRRFMATTPPLAGFDLSTLGFSSSLIEQLDKNAMAFPIIGIDGVDGLGADWAAVFQTTYQTFGTTATHTRGAHTFRIGGELRTYRDDSNDLKGRVPNMTFSTNWTRGPLDNAAGAPTGQGLASFLLGIPTSGDVTVGPSASDHSNYFSLFLQDDWRVSRRLTLNLGVRWEYESAPRETANRSVRGFAFSTVNPVQDRAAAAYARSPIPELPLSAFRTLGGYTFPGVNGQPGALWSTSKTNFAPRVGLAFQLTPKTVIRAGYGIFLAPNGTDIYQSNQAGFSRTTSVIPTNDNGITYLASLGNPFPNGLLQPVQPSLTTDVGRGITVFPSYRPTPYAQRWSFAIQQGLPGRVLAEISYVGSHTVHLAAKHNTNTIPRQYLSTSPERDPTTISYVTASIPNPFYGLPEFEGSNLTGKNTNRTQLLRPFPEFIGVTVDEPTGYSNYNSLQARLQKHLSSGWNLTAGYTYSKYMEATSYLNDTDPGPERAVSTDDRPHVFTASSIYEIPVGKKRRLLANAGGIPDAVIGGWQVQAIYAFQPYARPLPWGNVLFRGNVHDIPLSSDQRTPERWFNTDAGFERSSALALSQNVRTFPSVLSGVRGAGFNTWNLAGLKQFRLGERLRFQLRTQWQCAFNTPQFADPQMNPTNKDFGRVTGTRGEARAIYVGAKLLF